MSSDDGTQPGDADRAARLVELLEQLERLPAVPRSARCSDHRLQLCAEIEAVIRARREHRGD